MQKRYVVIFIFILILVLAGCTKSNQPTPNPIDEETPSISENLPISITALPINHEEHTILKAGGVSHSFIYELKVNTAESILAELWVDKYVNGELVEAGSGIKSKLEPNMSTFLYVTHTTLDEGQEMWSNAIRQEGNIGSNKQFRTLEQDFSVAISSTSDAITTNYNESVELGYLARNKESGLSYSTNDIEELIRNNDEVFIIRCKVILD